MEKFQIEMKFATSYQSTLTVDTRDENIHIRHENNSTDGTVEEVSLTVEEVEVLIEMLHKAWDNLR